MFDIGNIFNSIAKAVLPMAIDAIGPDAASTHPGTPPSPGPAAPVIDPLFNFVATNGLHSIAPLPEPGKIDSPISPAPIR